MRLSVVCFLSVFYFGLVGASDAPIPGKPHLHKDGWALSDLQAAGFNVSKMQVLTDKLINDDHSNAHAVIIEYDNKLIYEQYLDGSDENWGSALGNVKFELRCTPRPEIRLEKRHGVVTRHRTGRRFSIRSVETHHRLLSRIRR